MLLARSIQFGKPTRLTDIQMDFRPLSRRVANRKLAGVICLVLGKRVVEAVASYLVVLGREIREKADLAVVLEAVREREPERDLA